MTSPEQSYPTRLRILLISSLSNLPPTSAILLSGGVDTTALLSLIQSTPTLSNLHNIKHAITVATSDSRDLIHASLIAQNRNLVHHVVTVSANAAELFDPVPNSPLEQTIKIMKRFDPMDLRNSLIIYTALLRCKELGIDRVITGDGADELFAGYSFLRSVPRENLRNYMDTTFANMAFSAKTLGSALGISVIQPFLSPQIIEFAHSLPVDQLIGPHPSNSSEEGKIVLRHAVPESESAWRVKEPIETGSGMTQATELFFQSKSLDVVEVGKIKREDGVNIRDSEQLYYYRIFRRLFYNSTTKQIEIPGRERNGTDPCIECGWQLEDARQLFCVVCGAWPARVVDKKE